MRDQFSNTQAIRKPAVTSKGGIVAAQSSKAAQVGAEVLAAGGDCVDAVIATTFALGVLEPWMSGPGGGGAMVLYRAREDRYEVIDYGMRAPASLNAADYPLTGGGAASDIFPWPRVKDDRNLHGPSSIAIPGVVAGMEEAHRRHAKLPWKELLAPSVKLAGEGLAVDWWTTLMISSSAADLRRYPASAAAYLVDGLPPNAQWGIKSDVRMPQDRLKATMAQLASAGPRDFYEGDLANSLAADIQAAGGALSVEDLKPFRAHLREPLAIPYRGGKVFATPELTAGPTLSRTLGLLQKDLKPARGGPDAAAYVAYASALQAAYRERLKDMGDEDGRRSLGAEALAPACTTHFSAVDRDGNMAAVTQTLLSTFGSKFVSSQTGITMNNGIMWFDPDAGHAELAGAGQALPDQLHAGAGAGQRWPPHRHWRFRRPAHPAGGEPASLLRDGLRHGPRCGDPPAPHRRQRRRRRDRRCSPAAGRARSAGRAFRLRGSAHPDPADEIRLPQHRAARRRHQQRRDRGVPAMERGGGGGVKCWCEIFHRVGFGLRKLRSNSLR